MSTINENENNPLSKKKNGSMWERFMNADMEKIDRISGRIHEKAAGTEREVLETMKMNPAQQVDDLKYASRMTEFMLPKMKKKEGEDKNE